MPGRHRSAAPHRHRGALRGEGGFTLIEVLIALIVLAVGILGAARLVASSEASTLDAELQQIATEEAEQAIEDVRALDYADIGHGTAGLPNGGEPYESPDAPRAEDMVVLGSGAGIVPSRTFAVERGDDKPPVTGTIETFVTWRDEECVGVDVSSLPAVATLEDRISDLQTSLDPLAGEGGRVTETINDLGPAIEIVPADPPPEALLEALTDLSPGLDQAAAQIGDAQDALDQLGALPPIDLCDLEPADLAGLRYLLELDSSGFVLLADALEELNQALVAVEDPLNDLLSIYDLLKKIVCSPLLDPSDACGRFTSAVQQALQVLDPGNGQGDPPRALLEAVNPILADIARLDFSGLRKDTTHNTKRITVAVTVDTGRDDITPQNTIWLSSVVTDPDAGLIISGGL